MNAEETLALWRQGKDAWASWASAILEKKKALEKAGQWSVDWYGEGQNEESKAWLEEAATNFAGAVFEESGDFSGKHFPGPSDFDGARFAGPANFSSARFAGNLCFTGAEVAGGTFDSAIFLGLVNFDRTQFTADTSFEKAEFLKTGGLEPCTRFHRAQFAANANFTGALFAGEVRFMKTSFASACFDRCDFKGDALFTAAQFDVTASFIKARFSGSRVDFAQAAFRGDTRFLEARFGGSRGGLMISGACSANFESTQFEREASFRQVWFAGESEFKNVQFKGFATFDGARFGMPAGFAPAVFSASSSFGEAQFAREANFAGSQFLKDCDFTGVKFGGEAHFDQVRFAGAAFFASAQFAGDTSFRAAAAEAVFALDAARYASMPDFGEANFAQPPALDKMVKIKPKWHLFRRVLKPAPGTAAVAENTAAGLETAAAAGAPAPVSEETGAGKQPAAQETAETVFQFPEYGDSPRQCVRPRASRVRPPSRPEPQAVHAAAFAGLGSHHRRVHAALSWPASGGLSRRRSAMASPGLARLAILGRRPCLAEHRAGSVWDGAAWLYGAIGGLFSTGPCVHGTSQPVAEAVFLAAKNALMYVPWENDHAIRRVYGCLYGLEGEVPTIPVAVSLYSLTQALLSVTLFVMFFIALIERLKKK